MMDERSRVIDLSYTVDTKTPPFPGDPPVDVTVFQTVTIAGGRRSGVNASGLRMSLHCGTHMDAPFHFFNDGATIDAVALEACFGPAVVVRAGDAREIGPETITGREVEIQRTRRVIFDSGWSGRWQMSEFFTRHPVLAAELARRLVELGVVLVGVDFPSVDRPPHETHEVLLGNGVLIVENLANLEQLPSEVETFVALPLRIGGRDGSPVRAVAVVAR